VRAGLKEENAGLAGEIACLGVSFQNGLLGLC